MSRHSEFSFVSLALANNSRATQWTSGKNMGLEFAVIELLGEAGELANALKKFLRWKAGIAVGNASYSPIIEELADVVICADLVARSLGVSLGAIVAKKFNADSEKRGFPQRLLPGVVLRPRSEWHEDDGPVLWFEDDFVDSHDPPYFGTPNDSDKDGMFTCGPELRWWCYPPDVTPLVAAAGST